MARGWTRVAWCAAGLFGASGVAMAAIAAHLAPETIDAAGRSRLGSAVQMQMWHALALLGAGAVASLGGRIASVAIGLMIAGTMLFCGGLYAAVFLWAAAVRIAPFGGTLLIASWASLAVAGALAGRGA